MKLRYICALFCTLLSINTFTMNEKKGEPGMTAKDLVAYGRRVAGLKRTVNELADIVEKYQAKPEYTTIMDGLTKFSEFEVGHTPGFILALLEFVDETDIARVEALLRTIKDTLTTKPKADIQNPAALISAPVNPTRIAQQFLANPTVIKASLGLNAALISAMVLYYTYCS